MPSLYLLRISDEGGLLANNDFRELGAASADSPFMDVPMTDVECCGLPFTAVDSVSLSIRNRLRGDSPNDAEYRNIRSPQLSRPTTKQEQDASYYDMEIECTESIIEANAGTGEWCMCSLFTDIHPAHKTPIIVSSSSTVISSSRKDLISMCEAPNIRLEPNITKQVATSASATMEWCLCSKYSEIHTKNLCLF